MCLSIAVRRPDLVLEEGEFLGFQYTITHNGNGYRCGYVRVPIGHPWHSKEYNDVDADVHGGLTFFEADMPCNKVGDDTDWWVGFDCAHAGDALDLSLMSCHKEKSIYSVYQSMASDGEVRTTEYVRQQCINLCDQAFSASGKHLLCISTVVPPS